MKWKITFFNDKVEAQTLKLPSGILANFLHIAEMIENMGPNLGRPYVGRLDSSLYEIRAKGKEGIARSVYCALKKREIIILHTFIKKSEKTPKKELNLAKKRMKEILK